MISFKFYPPTLSNSCTLLFLCCLPVCLLASCGNTQRSQLVGTWEIEQADKLTRRLKVQDREAEAAAQQQAHSSLMTVQFANSGQLKTSTRIGDINRTKEGTWSLVSFDEATQTATVECKIGLQQSTHAIKLIGEDMIEMVPPNMAGLSLKLRFSRVKSSGSSTD